MDTAESAATQTKGGEVPLFGARKKARELVKEMADLRAELDRLGGMTVIELEDRREKLAAEITSQQEQIETERVAAQEVLEREAGEATAALNTAIEAGSEKKAELESRFWS